MKDSLGTSNFAQEANLELVEPNHPTDLKAILNGPNVIGACRNLELSAAESIGNAGKELEYEWKYRSESHANHDAVQALLSSKSAVQIDSDVLLSGNHLFEVQVKNWLGFVSFANISVSKVGVLLPTISVPFTTVSVRRSESLVIATKVKPAKCGGSELDVGYVNKGIWTQLFSDSHFVSEAARKHAEAGLITNHAVFIQNPNSITLRIPKDTLRMGATYAFNLKVSSFRQSSFLGSINETFIVQIPVEPVIARIKGGSSRQAPVIEGKTFQVEFDASPSSDPANTSASLQFAWYLEKRNATSTQLISLDSVPNRPSLLRLDTSILSDFHKEHAVYVNVTGVPVIGHTVRIASAFQTIQTTNVEIPLITTSLDARGHFSADAQTMKYNIGQRFILGAQVSNYPESSVEFTWGLESGSFDLTNRSLVRTSLKTPQLVLADYALASDVNYVFSVTVINPTTTQRTVGTLEFKTNDLPSPGRCLSQPASGTALLTVFRLDCPGWSDEDTPLSYEFHTKHGNSWIPVCEPRRITYYDTILPSSKNAGSNLTIRGRVTDSIGAFSEVTFEVQVNRQQKVNFTNLKSSIDSKLAEGDTQTFSVLVAGTANSLRNSTNDNSGSNDDKAAKKAIIDNLVGSIENFVNSTTQTGASKFLTPLSLINTVTDFEDPEELSEDSRTKTIDVIKTLSEDPENQFSTEIVLLSISTIGNILESSKTSDVTSGDSANDATSKRKKAELSDSIVDVFSQLSSGQLKNAIDGEDAIEVVTPIASLSSRKTKIDHLAGSDIRSEASGTEFSVPTGFDVNQYTSGNASVEIMLTSVNNNMFPSENNDTTGTLLLELKQSGNVLKVENSAEAMSMTMTGGPSDGKVAVCRFWDTTLSDGGSWSTEGVETSPESTSNTTKCLTTHLSAFSAEMTVDLNINTFTADDITAENFTSTNYVFVFCCSLFGVYLIVAAHAMYKDSNGCRKTDENVTMQNTVSFWRSNNFAINAELNGERSMDNLTHMVKWKMKRNHPWISIYWRPEGDYYISLKRLSVVVVLIYNSLTVSFLIAGQDQQILFLKGFFAESIFIMMLTFPVPALLAYLFKRPTPTGLLVSFEKANLNGIWGCFLYSLSYFSEEFQLEGDEAEENEGEEETGYAVDPEVLLSGTAGINIYQYLNVQNEGENKEKRVSTSKDEVKDKNAAERSEENAVGAVYHATGMSSPKHGTGMSSPKETSELTEQSNMATKETKTRTRASTGADLARLAKMLGLEEETDDNGNKKSWEKKDLIVYSADHRLKFDKARFDGQEAGIYNIETGSYCGCCSKDKKVRDVSPNAIMIAKDVIGLIFCVVVIAGCTFVMSILAAISGTADLDFIWITTYSMGEDIVIRILLIVAFQALLFLPCLCAVSNWKINKISPIAPESDEKIKRIKFISGQNVGFLFRSLRVVGVRRNYQADRFGVRRNWKIVAIGDEMVQNDTEADRALQSIQRINANFTVYPLLKYTQT